MKRNILIYAVFIIISLAIGFASAYVTGNIMSGYEGLNMPPLSPPQIVFPIVWTILYILMGIGAAMVYLSGGQSRGRSLTLFVAQLFVNFFWSVIFFGLEMRLAAFFWLLLLIVLVIAMIRSFAADSVIAAYLQIPYLIWLMFALYLNLMFYLFNP